MSTPNGYGTETSWERGRKKKAVPSPPAAVAAPAPAGVDVGSGIAKGSVIDPRYILGGSLAVIGLVSLLFLFFSIAAANHAQHQATPAPVSTPVPTATAGETYIEMVDQLLSEKQWEAAARMAEKALKTVQLTQSERTALHERALTAKLHVLLAAPMSPLNVTAQQQAILRYRYLQKLAADAGVSFPTNLEGARLAKDAGKLLLSKLLFEAAFTAGEYSTADQDTLRLYTDVLYRIGWYFAQGPDTLKAEGVRLLAASQALSEELGITHGPAWIELVKYKGADERNWPQPAPTPLLPTTQNGGSE